MTEFSGIHYDVGVAMANMILTDENATDDELRGILVAGSDIPEDRLDVALSETKEGLAFYRHLVILQETQYRRPLTVEETQELVAEATWIDDGERNWGIEVEIVDEDTGEQIGNVKASVKLGRNDA